MKRDYYEILGISKNADEDAIKKAYRKLAKKYHPDSNDGNEKAAERFKEITEAYTVLGDKEKRKLYDQFGHAAFDGTGNAAGGYQDTGNPFWQFWSQNEGKDGSRWGQNSGKTGAYQSQSGGKTGTHWSQTGPDGTYTSWSFEGNPEDLDDIFSKFFGRTSGKRTSAGNGRFYGNASGFGANSAQSAGRGNGNFGSFGNDGFSGYRRGGFSGSGSNTAGSEAGANLRARIQVTFEEAAFGASKTIHLNDGGQDRSYEVKIPAGIESGKTIRLKGKGAPGRGGAPTGDLLLEVQVSEKPGYRRKGQDLYTTAKIPYTTAVFGGETTVETIYGRVLCKIQPGTQSGTKIRLKNKGIVSMQNPGERGDQYISVEIDVPKHLSHAAVRKLKEYEQILQQQSCSG